MELLCLGIMTCDILVKAETEHIFEYDTTLAQSISLEVGGDALNVAINLSKMGISSGICGKVGRDVYGEFIEKVAIREGVDVTYLERDDRHASSTSIVLISKEGNRNFIYYPGATAEFSGINISLEDRKDLKVIAIGSYFALPSFTPGGMETLLKNMKMKGVMTVLDVTNNPQATDLPVLERLLPYVDYFIPSYEEAKAISERTEPHEIARFFRKKGAKTVIVKLGEKGAFGLSEKESVYVPATPDLPVDTTGAGDCFVAGIIAASLHGYSLKESLIFACKAAGLSITKIGATTATTYFDEINNRHKNHGKQEGEVSENHYDNI